MPLLVPLALALLVVLGAAFMWVHVRYLAQRDFGAPSALAVSVLAAAGMWAIVASEQVDDPGSAALGWSLLAVAALGLAGGWLALLRWAPARRDAPRRR
ncbi:hypothetical protein OVA14_06300 [Agrococcus sp. SL85]|uniref:hypothetical protein n=1 Tax=Agrococcus sp. SL85 TaxID=2995141 RepID=UPI00226D06E1|nr:hypothetical protein [Agrococcus sp. SL85]WAC67340.1 hypothetical protein OVA14_06300 [Agrococcus sp. SL85]